MHTEASGKSVEPFGDNKISMSKGTIEKTKRETWESITKIRTQADEMENNRRIKEEFRREERGKKIGNEIYSNETKNVGMIFNWQQIEKMENTEELAKEVEKQNEECDKILETKDTLITELEEELVQKDEEYKDSLKKMGQDIDQMIEEMRKQYYDMRNLYATELVEIEAAFKRERQEILKRNRQEIDKLLKDHDELEKNNQALRLNNEEDYSKKLEDIRKKNVFDYMNDKMLLEQEKQNIERALEELKSVFVLNQALLEYNVKVLKEKQTENEQICKDIEEKVKRNRNRRHALKKDIEESDAAAEKDNMKYTRDYKRISQQFSVLQKKFQHFQKADKQRYEEIKAMNEAEVKSMMQKIIKADKVIHMQQLGISYTHPQEYIVNYLEGHGSAMGMTGAIHETSSLIEGSRAAGRSEGGEDQSVMTRNLEDRVPIARINAVFQVIIQETGFLIDSQMKEQIRKASLRERYALQVEAICSALNIEKGDIELLVNTFYESAIQPSFMDSQLKLDEELKVEDKKEDLEEEKKDPDMMEIEDPEDRLTIDPDSVIEILDKFMTKRKQRMELPDIGTGVQKRKKKNMEIETEQIEKERKRDREHWEKLSLVLDEAKLNLWNALYNSLSKYYGLLQERQNLIEETGLLNQQNEELKTLLNQYLLAGVNQELKIPPTQIIKIDVPPSGS